MATAEAELGERVADEAVEKAVRQGHDGGDHRRVDEPPHEVAIGEHLHVIVEGWRDRDQPQVEDLPRALERGRKHVEQRRDHDQAADQQHGPGDHHPGAQLGELERGRRGQVAHLSGSGAGRAAAVKWPAG